MNKEETVTFHGGSFYPLVEGFAHSTSIFIVISQSWVYCFSIEDSQKAR